MPDPKQQPKPNGRKGKTKNRHTKNQRAELAAELWLLHRVRSVSIRHIANMKNMSYTTARYFILEGDRQFADESIPGEHAALGKLLWHSARERQKHRWILYQQASEVEVRRKLLDAIAWEEERMLKIGQSLGLIHREPDKVFVQHEELDKLSKEDLSARLIARLAYRSPREPVSQN